MNERFIESLYIPKQSEESENSPFFKAFGYTKQDEPFDHSLRPKQLSEFVGQEKICEQLDVIIQAAKLRGEVLGHCLFSGPPGLGKTTLSYILSEALGSRIVVTSGPAIERPADLAIELSKIKEGEILFIDEIHRMNRTVEEYLYSAMEDFVLDIPKSTRIPISRFTLVGATTRPGLLSSPFRSRFFFSGRLDFYDVPALMKIIERSCALLHFAADRSCIEEIAKRSRGTPRIANRLLRWTRDFVSIKSAGTITQRSVKEALNMLLIDELGLDEMDFRILYTIEHRFGGGPVGVHTIATAVSEESDTIEEVHEPFLITCGFLKKTQKGREITALGKEHVKRTLAKQFFKGYT